MNVSIEITDLNKGREYPWTDDLDLSTLIHINEYGDFCKHR